ASGGHLRPCLGRGSSGGADGGTFSVSGNGSDQGVQIRAASHHFSRARVGANTLIALLSQILSVDCVASAAHFDGLQVECNLRCSGYASSINFANDEFGLRSLGNDDLP